MFTPTTVVHGYLNGWDLGRLAMAVVQSGGYLKLGRILL
jgi:hypothetical protein